jgi:hypothetical protein
MVQSCKLVPVGNKLGLVDPEGHVTVGFLILENERKICRFDLHHMGQVELQLLGWVYYVQRTESILASIVRSAYIVGKRA